MTNEKKIIFFCKKLKEYTGKADFHIIANIRRFSRFFLAVFNPCLYSSLYDVASCLLLAVGCRLSSADCSLHVDRRVSLSVLVVCCWLSGVGCRVLTVVHMLIVGVSSSLL